MRLQKSMKAVQKQNSGGRYDLFSEVMKGYTSDHHQRAKNTTFFAKLPVNNCKQQECSGKSGV